METCFNDTVINYELTDLPHKLSCFWIATRDVQLRKWSFSPSYHYDLHFQLNDNPSHGVLLLLLAGDIAANPSPHSSTPRINIVLECQESSIVRKLDELQVLANDVDLLAVTETWLRPDIKDCELLPKLNFTIFRKDRVSLAGGGVIMLAIRNTTTCVRRVDLECSAEVLFCEMHPVSKRKLPVAVFYRPPDSSLEYMKEPKKSLRFADQIILGGDLNLPNID